MNFLQEMARSGAAVDVIAPRSWPSEIKRLRRKKRRLSLAPLRVTQPFMTIVPLRLRGAERQLTAFNERRFAAAVAGRIWRDSQYDFAYAHFLPAGRALLRAVEEERKELMHSVFLNMGESDPWDYDKTYGEDTWARELSRFAGVITVSKKNYDYLLSRNSDLKEKLTFIPNGVNMRRFKSMDRRTCREKLGLPESERLSIFCGHFDHRKGPLRVLAAIRRLGMRGIFLGSNGPDIPSGPEVVFVGPVKNEDMPMWYNAADVFVLPSLSEGMSNAMLEALACGLPLVVADRDFNHGFLTDECTSFVDPNDPVSIAKGIETCLSTSNYDRMCAASLQLAERYSVETRAARVLAFAGEQLAGPR